MKNIKDLIVNDIIYIRRNKNGYMVDLKCHFLGIKKGLIIGEIIAVYPDYYKFYFSINKEIKSRKNLCFIRAERKFHDGSFTTESCYWLNPKTGDFE